MLKNIENEASFVEIFNYDDNSFRMENPLIFMRDKFVFFIININRS